MDENKLTTTIWYFLKPALFSLPFLFTFSSFNSLPLPFSEGNLMGHSPTPLFGQGFQLQKEAAFFLNDLIFAAKKEGFQPHLVSSYRSYAHQEAIWNRKYRKYIQKGFTSEESIQKIIEYSTIPGTSRHHWGTDFDIIDLSIRRPKDLLNPKHFKKNGPYYGFKKWMNKHAETYCFYEVYTDELERKGFKYEPWHFSYEPISVPMLNEYRKLDLNKQLREGNILGSETFTPEFIEKYYQENILSINPKLR